MRVISRLAIGIVWFIIYTILVGGFVCKLYGVTPFNLFFIHVGQQGWVLYNPFEDWIKLYKAFMFENWTINSLYDFSILSCFFLFFPICAWGWYKLCRIKWRIKRKSEQKGDKSSLISERKMLRPRAMPMTGRGSFVPVSPVQSFKDKSSDQKEKDSSDQTSIQERMNYLEKKAQQYGIEVFKNVALEGYIVPIVLATDTKAFLFDFFDKPGTEWIVEDTSFKKSELPKWYSAEDQIISPFHQLCKAAHVLRMKEEGAFVCPVLLIIGGELLNADTLKEEQEKENGFVLKDSDLEDFLRNQFQGLKGESEGLSIQDLLDEEEISSEEKQST